MMKNITIRNFNEQEKYEISNYIKENTPFTILERVQIITELPIQKAEIFILCYRLISDIKNIVSTEELKNKLESLLNECESLYSKIFELLLKKNNESKLFNYRLDNKIINILKESVNAIKINKFISIFLVFAEKRQLLDLDKIFAIDLETKEGRDAYKDIMSDENREEF